MANRGIQMKVTAAFYGLTTGALIGIALPIVALAGNAVAAPSTPHAAWSYYVETTSNSTMYTLGCNQGTNLR